MSSDLGAPEHGAHTSATFPEKYWSPLVGGHSLEGQPTLAIDASRNLSGGAIEFLQRVIRSCPASDGNFSWVHIWVHPSVADKLPPKAGVTIHFGKDFFLGKIGELLWQMLFLRFEIALRGCDALVVLDTTYLGTMRPNLILNQDLLAFDSKEVDKYPPSLKKMRLRLIKFIQVVAMRRAMSRVFLSEHSRSLIGAKIPLTKKDVVIPHGRDEKHDSNRSSASLRRLSRQKRRDYISISPVSRHKNYPQLLLGFEEHLRSFPNDRLTVVGGFPDKKLWESINKMLDSRPGLAASVEFTGQISHHEVFARLSRADIFVFSSSCEACGIAVIEGVDSGLPMAVSEKSSIPEIVGQRAVYFDPDNPKSIAQTLGNFEALIESTKAPISEALQPWEIRMEEFWCHVHETTTINQGKQAPFTKPPTPSRDES